MHNFPDDNVYNNDDKEPQIGGDPYNPKDAARIAEEHQKLMKEMAGRSSPVDEFKQNLSHEENYLAPNKISNSPPKKPGNSAS